MTTDKTPATLATAKHGGCVHLGVNVSDEDRAVLQRLQDALPTAGINGWAKGVEVLESLLQQSLGQPSPGGQGDARSQFEEYRGGDCERDAQGYYTNARTAQDWAMWQAALAARQPVEAAPSIDYEDLLDQTKDLIHCGCSVNGAFEWLLEQLTDGEALAARQPVGEHPMEMRICELRHVSLKPNRPYVFTVDANCAKCRADAAYALGRTDSKPAQAVDPADPWRGLYSPDLMPKLDGVNMYHVAHPDLPSWPKDEDEERGIGPLITAQGFAVEVVFGEYPDDDGEAVDYCAWLATWSPESPKGADWRLVCIQDTEDGPAAFFVRPLALIDSQAVGNG